MTAADVQELLVTVRKNENRLRTSDNTVGSGENGRSHQTRCTALSASLRQWAMIWPSLKGWTTQYDPTVIAATASETDWTTFREVLAETNAFARRAQVARSANERPRDDTGDQTLFDATDSAPDGHE